MFDHLKKIDHRYLPNPSHVKFLNINYTSFFEYTHKVVVCLKTRNVYTRKTYKSHKKECSGCAHNYPVSELAVDLVPGEMIQGLKSYCIAGNLYQIIENEKWIILPRTPKVIVLQPSSTPVDGIQGHVPVFMEANSLGVYLLDQSTSDKVMSTTYSDLEQAVYDASMVYFLHGLFKLNTTSAQRLRIYLKNRCLQDGVRMFQPVRSDTALEYANFFSHMTVILYRNSFSAEERIFRCSSRDQIFKIDDEERFQNDRNGVKSILFTYKCMLKETVNECYEYPFQIEETPANIEIDILRDRIQTGNYNVPFSLYSQMVVF